MPGKSGQIRYGRPAARKSAVASSAPDLRVGGAPWRAIRTGAAGEPEREVKGDGSETSAGKPRSAAGHPKL
jgi:hypothetical protein